MISNATDNGRAAIAASRDVDASGAGSRVPNYALIFRTHFWDDFAQRQLQRVQSQTKGGHVYVVVDETRGPIDGIAHDRVVRITEHLTERMGLKRAGHGPVFWYNGDYPLYYSTLR